MVDGPHILWLLWQERFRHHLAEVEHDRLVAAARRARTRRGFYCGVMCALGRLLMRFGQELVTEFGESPAERPATQRRRHA